MKISSYILFFLIAFLNFVFAQTQSGNTNSNCQVESPTLRLLESAQRKNSEVSLESIEAKVNGNLDRIEQIYLEAKIKDDPLTKSHLGYFFERIREAKRPGQFFPHETKNDAYQALLKNIRPKKFLELRDEADVDDEISELGVKYDYRKILADPVFGIGSSPGAKISNPYYELQLKLVLGLSEATWPGPLFRDENARFPTVYTELNEVEMNDISKLKSAVIIVPDDEGHLEDRGAKELVRSLLRRSDIDWIASEMIPDYLQTTVDTYVFGNSNTEEWKKAERDLRRYFANMWDILWEKKQEELAAFSIIQEARRQKKRVIALDVSNSYNLTKEGADFSGIACMLLRNHLWAERTPKNGRGVLFGGEDHFKDGIFGVAPWNGLRVQDFLKKYGHENIFWLSQKQPLGARLRDQLDSKTEPTSK